ncbi:MAG: BREX system Lon protease-like protein BrxL, partial [Verrucomicrobia bacterium]|nr:BREX system Lon protease-like protein BrxL [Verrucomicrobiota bacterium]
KGRVKTLLQNQPVKLVDEISVEVDALADEPTASIPLLGIKARIDPEIPLKNPGLYGAGLWVELTVKKDQGAKKSTIRVDEVEPIAPELDPERIASMRKAMTTKEWMAFLLRSIGYNPNVYSSTQQLWLLTRLLPLIEPRVNLIELAPKGTGKTYVFKSVSRHTLVQTAMMSRANLFGDMAGRNPGIFDQHYDCIVQDEIQSARFSDPKEVIGTLKDYLETGSCTVGGKTMTSTTSFVMLGNIPIEHGQPMHPHLFSAQNCLPEPFMETAFLDRFNGILPGWELPKVRSDAKASGLGLQMGVIAQLLHVLRKFDCSEILERYVKPELYPEPNIRDVKSVRRLGSAYLKLLFPHMEVTGEDFVKYCFSPAVQLRARLYRELELRDPGEYKGMTRFTIGEPAKQKAGSV